MQGRDANKKGETTMPDIKDFCGQKGRRGEINAYADLVCWAGPRTVMRDLLIPNPGGKTDFTDIDLLFLHASGVYVMEVKDWAGRYYVDEKREDWAYVIPDWDKGCEGGKRSSPLDQNGTHVRALRELFGDERCALPIYPIAVFTDERCRIIRLDYPWEKPVVYLRDLRAAIACTARENGNRLPPGYAQHLYDCLTPWTNPPQERRRRHIRQVTELRESMRRGRESA